MLYAHLIIRRKPQFYVVNLVIPTAIIALVAVTGFFTPTSSTSDRDEKLYLGASTLLTMFLVLTMVCNKMPSTSSYVPLMSWYYMGIIAVIVIGVLLATVILAIHGQKQYRRPLSKNIRRLVHNSFVSNVILEPPLQLLDLWNEYGLVDGKRLSMAKMDPLLQDGAQLQLEPAVFFSSISSQVSQSSAYSYERRLASITQQYTMHARQRQREKHERFLASATRSNARDIKRQKMIRRCNLEWEYLANVLDRVCLVGFLSVTLFFFCFLIAFDSLFDVHGVKTGGEGPP